MVLDGLVKLIAKDDVVRIDLVEKTALQLNGPGDPLAMRCVEVGRV